MPDDPDNADLAAMQSLMYDECTAAERAENFKVLACRPSHRIASHGTSPAGCLALASVQRFTAHRRHPSVDAVGRARGAPPHTAVHQPFGRGRGASTDAIGGVGSLRKAIEPAPSHASRWVWRRVGRRSTWGFGHELVALSSCSLGVQRPVCKHPISLNHAVLFSSCPVPPSSPHDSLPASTLTRLRHLPDYLSSVTVQVLTRRGCDAAEPRQRMYQACQGQQVLSEARVRLLYQGAGGERWRRQAGRRVPQQPRAGTPTAGCAEQCPDPLSQSSGRAQAVSLTCRQHAAPPRLTGAARWDPMMRVGNNRHALHDCKHALTLDSENIKVRPRSRALSDCTAPGQRLSTWTLARPPWSHRALMRGTAALLRGLLGEP